MGGAAWSVLDRSRYGRVLVERVEGLCPPDEVDRSYDQIVEFESASPTRTSRLQLFKDEQAQFPL